MSSCDIDNQWTDNGDGSTRSFIGFIYLSFDETATKLSSTALVAYSVHVVFPNKSVRKSQCMMDNGHELVRFLQVMLFSKTAEKGGRRDWQNGFAQIYMINNGAPGELRTGYGRCSRERTTDSSTLRFLKSSKICTRN